jgi:hypothetical protein
MGISINEVLWDPVLAKAIIDRIICHCRIIIIEGEGYRMQNHKKVRLNQKMQLIIKRSDFMSAKPKKGGSLSLPFLGLFTCQRQNLGPDCREEYKNPERHGDLALEKQNRPLLFHPGKDKRRDGERPQ